MAILRSQPPLPLRFSVPHTDAICRYIAVTVTFELPITGSVFSVLDIKAFRLYKYIRWNTYETVHGMRLKVHKVEHNNR